MKLKKRISEPKFNLNYKLPVRNYFLRIKENKDIFVKF